MVYVSWRAREDLGWRWDGSSECAMRIRIEVSESGIGSRASARFEMSMSVRTTRSLMD